MQKNKSVYQTLKQLANNVENELKNIGVAMPIKNTDGSIKVAGYNIKKEKTGFYTVTDISNNIVVDNINLPQTAALIANDLSLGKFINRDLMSNDRKYGFLTFEQDVCKKSHTASIKRKDYDRAELLIDKYNIANMRAGMIKLQISREFEKLQSRINSIITLGN